jgi:dynein heavy chain
VVGAGRPCLLVGESGTAKTVTLARYLASLDPAALAVLGLNFSSRTSSLDVQRAIEDCVEKRTKVGGGAAACLCETQRHGALAADAHTHW